MQELINDLRSLIGDDFTVNGMKPDDAIDQLTYGMATRIFISASSNHNPEALMIGKEYIIQVDKMMTSKDDPTLRFHSIWNEDTPMPLRIMVCTILKETRGMYLVSAHGEPLGSDNCMKCGRLIVNPISRLYGLGPECGHHAYVNPFKTQEELFEHLDEVEANLRAITWTGWIIKAKIVACEEV